MRTIRFDAAYADMVERLAEMSHGTDGYEQKIFPTYKALMMFAAGLGYQYQEAHASRNARDFVEGRVIERDNQCIDLIYLVALGASRDPHILRDDRENERIDLWERHVNGGLQVMKMWWETEKPQDPYGCDALIDGLVKAELLPRSQVGSEEDPAF